jgi:hypothetical protein
VAASGHHASWEEKRKHPRISVSWPARLKIGDAVRAAQLKDISLGGAFVVCPQPLPLSEKFRMAIDPPRQAALELNAEVVWSNANVPENKIVNRGMGVRFVENSEEDRSRLNNVIMSFVGKTRE